MDFWDWLYPNWHTGYIRYYCDNITGDEVYNETFSVAYRNISSCLALVIGQISIIMTFIVIFILIKNHKEFSGSFYKIFIIASIMVILMRNTLVFTILEFSLVDSSSCYRSFRISYVCIFV